MFLPLNFIGEEEGGFEVASPVPYFIVNHLAIFLPLNYIGEEEGGFEVASPFHSPTTL